MWLASVTVGSDAIAPCPNAVPISIRRGDVRCLAARGHVVEHVGVGAVEQEADDVTRALVRIDEVVEDGAVLRREVATVGVGRAAEQRGDRRARRRRAGPRAATSPARRTPLPANTSGARDCTTPSEPCSPRCPPWSSQLCAAEWMTQRSGAAGESKSWAIWS